MCGLFQITGVVFTNYTMTNNEFVVMQTLQRQKKNEGERS